MNNGPYIPERGAGLTPQDFPNLPSGPALGFNSCSLCGHGGTSGSILARIREYVTFYANSDADLSDDMAIGRQEVSKSVMEILNEAAPVPAPRLEHVLELRDGDWSLEHPQVCRESKSLLDCPVHAVVKSHEDEMELWEHGRFNVGLDEYGELEKLSSAPPVGTQE
jgi:hypothetical protein